MNNYLPFPCTLPCIFKMKLYKVRCVVTRERKILYCITPYFVKLVLVNCYNLLTLASNPSGKNLDQYAHLLVGIPKRVPDPLCVVRRIKIWRDHQCGLLRCRIFRKREKRTEKSIKKLATCQSVLSFFLLARHFSHCCRIAIVATALLNKEKTFSYYPYTYPNVGIHFFPCRYFLLSPTFTSLSLTFSWREKTFTFFSPREKSTSTFFSPF